MRAHYVVHAKHGYIVERFRGPITFAELQQFLARQAGDERIAAHYHTISDYTQASVRMSHEDVQRFATLLSAAPYRRTGKRACVIANARLLAFTGAIAAQLAHTKLAVRCFTHRHAALRWVNPEAVIAQTYSKQAKVAAETLSASLKSSVSA